VVRALVIAAIVVGTAASAHAERSLCRPGAKYHGRALDLDVKDADVHDVMRLLADVGNINIVVADTVKARVTLRLKKVAWDLVACTIASVHKLDVTVHDNVVLVTNRGR
jgi:type II secretory pathway component HofQ